MEETVLTQLIEYIDTELGRLNEYLKANPYRKGFTTDVAQITFSGVKKKAISLLPKEREQIEKAFEKGHEDYVRSLSDEGMLSLPGNLFDNNFTQYKPKEDGK